jgi:hypothetical protein
MNSMKLFKSRFIGYSLQTEVRKEVFLEGLYFGEKHGPTFLLGKKTEENKWSLCFGLL